MLSQDNFNNFSKGTVAQTANKVANTAGYGSTVSFNSASNVGYQDGQMQGYQTNATEEYRNKARWDAKRVGTGNAISSVGKDLASMATADNASSDGDFDKFAKGSYNQGAISTAKTKGTGEVNLSSADLENIGRTVRASIEGEIGKGRGIKENYDKYGDDVYKTSSEFGERSGIAKTMEKIKAQGGVDNAVDIDALDSSMKASQQEGSVRGSEKAYKNKARRTGKDFNQVIEDLAEDMAEGKTSADIATVDTANGNGGYVNYMTRSANKKVDSAITALQGEQKANYIDSSGKLTNKGRNTVRDMAEGKASADIATVQTANKSNKDNGGYVGLQEQTANKQTDTSISTIKGEQTANMLNDDGTLTSQGKSTVSGSAELQSYQRMGNVSGMMNVMKDNPEYIKDFVNGMISKAQESGKNEEEGNARKKAVMDDLEKSGLIGTDDKGGYKVNPQNFARAKAFLNANNMNSHNSLIAGGMSFSGALGKNSSVQANALNSVVSGDRKEYNDDVDVINKGEQLNYDLIIDSVGNDTIGEIAKGVLQGAVALGALDTITGGKVRDRIASANKKLSDYRHSKKEGHKKGNDGKWYDLKTEKGREEFAKDPKNLENLDDATKEKYYSSSSPTALDGNKNPQSAAPTQSTINTNTAPNMAVDITDSSSKDLNNYNTSESKKAQNYNEKTLNDKKTDLIKKDPDKLARETMFNQAQQKYESNVDDFRSGKIDQDTFSKNNAKLSSFMSKVNSGADIGMKDLKDVGIKPTQELPMETKMSKNNKPYEVINTSEYGQQLKEVEASKIRVAEENLNKFDAEGNPKVEAVSSSSKTTVDTGKVQSPDVDTPKPQVQHPKIDNFATAQQAKASGMMNMMSKVPLVGKVAGIGLAGAVLANASDEWQQGNYAKSLFTASSLVDITGASDMALATIESREKMDAINASRQTSMYNNGGFVASLLNSSSTGRNIAEMMGIELPNSQMQQAQSQLTPSIAQNQLNNIPTAMPFMASNTNRMAQQGLMSMVQQQYMNNTQAFKSGTMTQSAYNNSNAQLASVLSSIANSQPVSQQSLEYAGINPQSLPMNNGNVDMTALNSMVN